MRPFSSALAGHTLICPVCKIGLGLSGHRYACEQCTGVFVENAALVDLMTEARGEAWTLPAAEGPPGSHACPVCSDAMTIERIATIELDRCPFHGVWFESEERAASLLPL